MQLLPAASLTTPAPYRQTIVQYTEKHLVFRLTGYEECEEHFLCSLNWRGSLLPNA